MKRDIEVLGTARHVVVQTAGAEVARLRCHTAAQLVLKHRHLDGGSAADALASPPVGWRGRREAEAGARLAALIAIARPLDAYVALIDDARA